MTKPYSASLIMTENCNLNCTYCFEKDKSVSMMTKEVAKKSVDFLIENAIFEKRDRIDFMFFGGEPLLNIDVIDYIYEYSIVETKKHKLGISGNITAYSDPRLKNIISKIENPLEKLDQLNGYLYERLDLNNKREIGLLTSDVKKVLPELVCTIKTEVTELIPDGVLETLDYSKITALLVEVCKEQQKRIEELEKKVV